MAKEEKVYIEKPQGHYCFACGTDNPIGLNLQFYRLGDTICSKITLEKIHEGWQNVAHGGIISALLDEVMSWAVMYSKKAFLMTRKMNIKYIRNVSIGIPLTVCGKLLDDSEPPKVKARAEIRDDKGRLLARSKGEFVVVPEERLSSVPEGLKQQVFSLFKKF
jgi:uncharacterized protein (TIGR00369 family)